MNTLHTLYQTALDADAHYSRVIEIATNYKRTRWTLTRADEAHDGIKAAYAHKIASDAAWLAFVRQSRVS